MKNSSTKTLAALALTLLAAALVFAAFSAVPVSRAEGGSPSSPASAGTASPSAEPNATAAPKPKPTTLQTAAENIGFVLTTLVIVADIALAALFFQRRFFKNRLQKVNRTRRITYTALFSSMAAVLMLLEFPLLFLAPEFYKLDFSEIPIMICTFFMGPVYGVIAELIKIMLKIMMKGTSTAFVGDFANFIVGCTFVLPASILYHANPGRKTARLGLLAGTLTMTVFGSAFNAFYLIPKFSSLFHMPIEAIVKMGSRINPRITGIGSLVIWAVAPFNLIKGFLVSMVTLIIYKPVSKALKLEFHKEKKPVQ